MVTKAQRREQILFELENHKQIIRKQRVEMDILKKELDFIRGHYNKTWEEEYLFNSK